MSRRPSSAKTQSRKPGPVRSRAGGAKTANGPADLPPPPKPLWVLVGAAGTLKSGFWQPLNDDFDLVHYPGSYRFSTGERFPVASWPDPPPLFTYKKVATKPDVAWFRDAATPIIVSDRFRDFIERHSPGTVQFLPIRVQGPDRASLYTNYWLTNWLEHWDCQPDKDAPELDFAAVPPGRHLAVVEGSGWWGAQKVICTDEFKRRLIAENFIGLRFDPVHPATKPESPVEVKPHGKPAMIIECRCDPMSRHFDVDAFLKRFPGTSYPSRIEGGNALYEYAMLLGLSGVDIKVVRKLLKAGYPVNVGAGASHTSPLAVTVQPKSPAMIRLLHQHGADWNVANAVGITPLLAAAADAPIDSIKLLLAFGARADAVDACKCGALHHLLESVKPQEKRFALKAAGVLIAAGASLHAKDNQQRTPLDVLESRASAYEGKERQQLLAILTEVRKLA